MVTQIIRGCGKARDIFPAIKEACKAGGRLGDIVICKLCGCRMYKGMKGLGPQVWVCTDPDCNHLQVEGK